MLVDLPDLGIPFSMDLIAVKRDFYKNSPKTVEVLKTIAREELR
jgi:hypothetical protein